MWQGKYRKWNPVPHLEDKEFNVEAVHDDAEGFRIWFSNSKAGVVTIVKFDNVLLYANSDEMYRLTEVKNLETLKFAHLFWQVEESELIKEFHRQSLEIYKYLDIKHYVFISGSACIDVLSESDPTFNNLIEEGHILFNQL